MTTISFEKLVDDISTNGELTEEDIKFIDEFFSNDIDKNAVIDLLSIPQSIEWTNIHEEFGKLLGKYLEKLFVTDGILSDNSAKELINLFDPDELLSPFERKALRKVAKAKYGREFQSFLDDRMV